MNPMEAHIRQINKNFFAINTIALDSRTGAILLLVVLLPKTEKIFVFYTCFLRISIDIRVLYVYNISIETTKEAEHEGFRNNQND